MKTWRSFNVFNTIFHCHVLPSWGFNLSISYQICFICNQNYNLIKYMRKDLTIMLIKPFQWYIRYESDIQGCVQQVDMSQYHPLPWPQVWRVDCMWSIGFQASFVHVDDQWTLNGFLGHWQIKQHFFPLNPLKDRLLGLTFQRKICLTNTLIGIDMIRGKELRGNGRFSHPRSTQHDNPVHWTRVSQSWHCHTHTGTTSQACSASHWTCCSACSTWSTSGAPWWLRTW